MKPGESALAFYTAENRSSSLITGVSTYNVTPMKVLPLNIEVIVAYSSFSCHPINSKCETDGISFGTVIDLNQ